MMFWSFNSVISWIDAKMTFEFTEISVNRIFQFVPIFVQIWSAFYRFAQIFLANYKELLIGGNSSIWKLYDCYVGQLWYQLKDFYFLC